jgi:hypothetical protein
MHSAIYGSHAHSGLARHSLRKTVHFLSFPYVCPEPVFVNIHGSKRPFLLTILCHGNACIHEWRMQWNVDGVPCVVRIDRNGAPIRGANLSEPAITAAIAAAGRHLEAPSPSIDSWFGLEMELCTEELISFYRRTDGISYGAPAAAAGAATTTTT